jgi:hypothetical protein
MRSVQHGPPDQVLAAKPPDRGGHNRNRFANADCRDFKVSKEATCRDKPPTICTVIWSIWRTFKP